MVASTFAEAGEFGIAREIARETLKRDVLNQLSIEITKKLDDLMMGGAFAEAGEFEIGRLKKEKYTEKRDRVPARKVVLQRKGLRVPLDPPLVEITV